MKPFYHIHVTSSQETPPNWKETIIGLRNGSTHQTDSMKTKHFIPKTPDIKKDVSSCLSLAKSTFNSNSRIKIELLGNLELFTQNYSTTHYRELHFKLFIPSTLISTQLQTLNDMCSHYKLALSTNPRTIHHDGISQFLNDRLYEGDFKSTNAKIKTIKDALHAHGIKLLSITDEDNLYDSNKQVDSWWA